MRIAAGILMILFGVKTIGFLVKDLIDWVPLFGWGYVYHWMCLIAIISVVFIITGGFFCLKKKYWKLCLASSIVLLLSSMLLEGWLGLPTYPTILLSIPLGFLPLIFVCLRESEWQKISA